MTDDTNQLLAVLIEQQRDTNRLLAALIEALADEGEDGGAAPATYMDGTPVASRPKPEPVEYVRRPTSWL